MTSDAFEASVSRRVLLMAGCYADAAPSMALAVAAALRMGAALEGVLARDPRLEGAALFPLARGSGALRVQSGERLRLAYAADARAFRVRLQQAATEASLRCGFRSDSGALPELALALRRPGDAVILGHRRFLALRGPVVLLADGESGGSGVAGLAGDLARRLGTRARVLPAGTALADIETLSATAIVLPQAAGITPVALAALVEAARCPVLLGDA